MMYVASYVFNSFYAREMESAMYRHPFLEGLLPVDNGFGVYVIFDESLKLVARSASYWGV